MNNPGWDKTWNLSEPELESRQVFLQPPGGNPNLDNPGWDNTWNLSEPELEGRQVFCNHGVEPTLVRTDPGSGRC